jgi:hypothetical protein
MAKILAQINENDDDRPNSKYHVLKTISDIKVTVLNSCSILFALI